MYKIKVKKAERVNERLHACIKRLRNNWCDKVFDFVIAIAWYSFYIISILFGLFWIVILTVVAVKIAF